MEFHDSQRSPIPLRPSSTESGEPLMAPCPSAPAANAGFNL